MEVKVGEYWKLHYKRGTVQIMDIVEILEANGFKNIFKVKIIESLDREAGSISDRYGLPEALRTKVSKGYNTPLWKVLNG